jgi:SAM-dependent methyltransferase
MVQKFLIFNWLFLNCSSFERDILGKIPSFSFIAVNIYLFNFINLKTMISKIIDRIFYLYNLKTFKREDDVVIDFIDSVRPNESAINFLEVGSGLCRFILNVRERYAKINVKCLELNKDLVELGRGYNLDVIEGNVVKMDFADDKFDIIHCSHVIEHLDYTAVTKSLDELLRILKPGGYLIIRSPLHYPGFYFDIDHIRPYPPESILNYFNNAQQQKVGSFSISEIKRWYRKEAVVLFNTNSIIAKTINFLFKTSWLIVNFPKSKVNGYIMILKKS